MPLRIAALSEEEKEEEDEEETENKSAIRIPKLVPSPVEVSEILFEKEEDYLTSDF